MLLYGHISVDVASCTSTSQQESTLVVCESKWRIFSIWQTKPLSATESGVLHISTSIKRLIDKINTAAHNNLCMAQNRQKRHYDIPAPVRKIKFYVGALVYIRDSGTILEQSKKLFLSISPQPLHTVSESAIVTQLLPTNVRQGKWEGGLPHSISWHSPSQHGKEPSPSGEVTVG